MKYLIGPLIWLIVAAESFSLLCFATAWLHPSAGDPVLALWLIAGSGLGLFVAKKYTTRWIEEFK